MLFVVDFRTVRSSTIARPPLNTVESLMRRGLSTTALGGNRKQFLRTRLVPVGALEKSYEFAGNKLVLPPMGIEPFANRRVDTPLNQMRAKSSNPFSLDVD